MSDIRKATLKKEFATLQGEAATLYELAKKIDVNENMEDAWMEITSSIHLLTLLKNRISKQIKDYLKREEKLLKVQENNI